MIDLLEQVGSRISRYFGSPNLESNKHSTRKEELFDLDTLSSLLDYESYDACELSGETHGLFLSKGSVGFTVECAPLVGGDNTAHRMILGLLDDILEESVSIQCLLFADHRIGPILQSHTKLREQHGELYHELIKQRAQFLVSSENVHPRYYRFIFSLSMPGTPSAELYKKLIDKKKRVLKSLKTLSYTYSWKPNDLLDLCSAFLNFDFSSTPLKKKWNPFQSFSSQIPSGGKISVEEEGITWEQDRPAILKTYRAVDYPDFWHLNLMGKLIGDFERDSFKINTPFYLHYGIHCPPQSKEESAYWMKSQIIEKQGQSSFLRKMIASLEDEVSEVAHVRRALTEGAKFVRTQLGFGFWASPSKANDIEQTARSLFRLENFKIQQNRYMHLPTLLSTLPMSWGEYSHDLHQLSLLRTTLSNESCNFIPIQGEWGGTHSPGMMLVGRRGQLINFNPFDGGTNYNTIVVGESGSGKSVFLQELLMNNLGTGGKVYVIDVGGSFEKMCEVVEGQKVEFDDGNRLCLNPFTNLPTNKEERNASFGALKSIISTMAHPTEGASDLEVSLIEKAIINTYKEKGNKATISDIAKYLSQCPQIEAKNLSDMLFPYTAEGAHAKYFEGEGNVDFHNPMVLIELEHLKSQPDLQAVVLQIFIMEVSRKVFLGDRKTPTIICIDEAWELLKAKQTAPFIETLARRLRKYNGSLVVGTQSVAEFYQSPGAMAAYENSSWACMLKQKSESISAYAEKSNAPESMIEILNSIMTVKGQYSEILISESSLGYSVARLYLDPFSQLLYSTSPEDRALLEPARKTGASITEIIKNVLKKRRGECE